MKRRAKRKSLQKKRDVTIETISFTKRGLQFCFRDVKNGQLQIETMALRPGMQIAGKQKRGRS